MRTYTPSEFAKQVYHGSVCEATVRNWLAKGDFDYDRFDVFKTRGGHWRITEKSPQTPQEDNKLLAFLES